MPINWRELVKTIKEVTTMSKSRYDEVFDMLAELEMRLFYICNDPGGMPIEAVEEVHEKVRDALVGWNHLGNYVGE